VARALVVEPEVLFMDEPFSALDVLTAETLRGELLELWLGKQIPTRAIFVVTHNIEEAVLLADRIIVLGRNPAHIHAQFSVDLPYPRDRKAPRFVDLVDLIYRALTRQDHPELTRSTFRIMKLNTQKRYLLPPTRPGGMAGLLDSWSIKVGRADLHVLANELSPQVDALLPTVDTAALLGLLKVEEATPSSAEGLAFAKADIQNAKIFRNAALANVPLLRQMEQALKAKNNRPLPRNFSGICSMNISARTKRVASSKPPSSGAATPNSSITTPPAAGYVLPRG
jgi:NitT/TauT family transport system ATP-binding protein